MMLITQKSRYGLRAVFELAKHFGAGPQKIADIAKAQAIPHRFLEAILHDLRQSRIVDSRRGSEGGYFLVRHPEDLTVEEVITFLQGPIDPMDCGPEGGGGSRCELYGDCVFRPMWAAARDAVRAVFEETTFASLVEQERIRHSVPLAASRNCAQDAGKPKENNVEDSALGDSPVEPNAVKDAPRQPDRGTQPGQFGPGRMAGTTAVTSGHAADGRM